MTIRQRIRDRLRPSFDFTVPDTPDVPHVAHYTHPDVRGDDQFSHIIGARTTEATWRMLGARQPDPMPRHQGRYHLVQFGHVTPFQALYLTHADALVEAAQGPEEAY